MFKYFLIAIIWAALVVGIAYSVTGFTKNDKLDERFGMIAGGGFALILVVGFFRRRV